MVNASSGNPSRHCWTPFGGPCRQKYFYYPSLPTTHSKIDLILIWYQVPQSQFIFRQARVVSVSTKVVFAFFGPTSNQSSFHAAVSRRFDHHAHVATVLFYRHTQCEHLYINTPSHIQIRFHSLPTTMLYFSQPASTPPIIFLYVVRTFLVWPIVIIVTLSTKFCFLPWHLSDINIINWWHRWLNWIRVLALRRPSCSPLNPTRSPLPEPWQ